MPPVINETQVSQPVPAADPNFIRQLWLGRIARLRYFLGSLFSLIISLLLVFVLVILWGVVLIAFNAAGSPSTGLISSLQTALGAVLPILIAMAILLPMYLMQAVLAIRRYHDLGWSGWFYLLLLVPIVNIVFALILLFKKGQSEINNYGAPPTDERKFLEDVFNAPPGKHRLFLICGIYILALLVVTVIAIVFTLYSPKTPATISSSLNAASGSSPTAANSVFYSPNFASSTAPDSSWKTFTYTSPTSDFASFTLKYPSYLSAPSLDTSNIHTPAQGYGPNGVTLTFESATSSNTNNPGELKIYISGWLNTPPYTTVESYIGGGISGNVSTFKFTVDGYQAEGARSTDGSSIYGIDLSQGNTTDVIAITTLSPESNYTQTPDTNGLTVADQMVQSLQFSGIPQ